MPKERLYSSIAVTKRVLLDYLLAQTLEKKILWQRYKDEGHIDHFRAEVKGIKLRLCLFERSGLCLYIDPNDDVVDWVNPFPRHAAVRDIELLNPLTVAIEQNTGERITPKFGSSDSNYENILENAIMALQENDQTPQA